MGWWFLGMLQEGVGVGSAGGRQGGVRRRAWEGASAAAVQAATGLQRAAAHAPPARSQRVQSRHVICRINPAVGSVCREGGGARDEQAGGRKVAGDSSTSWGAQAEERKQWGASSGAQAVERTLRSSSSSASSSAAARAFSRLLADLRPCFCGTGWGEREGKGRVGGGAGAREKTELRKWRRCSKGHMRGKRMPAMHHRN